MSAALSLTYHLATALFFSGCRFQDGPSSRWTGSSANRAGQFAISFLAFVAGRTFAPRFNDLLQVRISDHVWA
jgi:hypothetical protein